MPCTFPKPQPLETVSKQLPLFTTKGTKGHEGFFKMIHSVVFSREIDGFVTLRELRDLRGEQMTRSLDNLT